MQAIQSTDASIRRHALRVLQLSLAAFSLAGPAVAQTGPSPRPGAAAAATTATNTATNAADSSTAEAAFQRADADKDGQLSKAEAAQMPAVAQRFDELDSNRDGQLSLAEFLAGVMPKK